MRKTWPGVLVATVLLAACSSSDQEQQQVPPPQPASCSGPVVEIGGADPHYEQLNPGANQDYEMNGKSYKIVQDASSFSEIGLAAIYDGPQNGGPTASGEAFDAQALTAAHPTLPIPGYVRITNMANGRQLVVRINDRGPFIEGRVIALSRATADRLNTSNNTKVRIDAIQVAPDGSVSGPGTVCTTIAKQSYALPARPDLSGGMGSVSSASQPPEPQGAVRAISNDTLKSDDSTGAPPPAGGFLGAPTPLPSGVLESDTPPAAPVAAPANTPVTAPGSVSAPVTAPAAAVAAPVAASANGNYMIQVGAVSDPGRANQLQQSLSQRFATPGKVSSNGSIYRIQLGPFASRQEAAAMQQRLLNEAQQQSFITTASGM